MCNQNGFYIGEIKPVVSLIKLLGGKPDVPCPCALCVLKRDQPKGRFYNCVNYSSVEAVARQYQNALVNAPQYPYVNQQSMLANYYNNTSGVYRP